MSSQRKFYRAVIEVEVLAEEEPHLENMKLESIAYAIVYGDWSGTWEVKPTEKVDGPTMAKLLRKQGSDPAFFQLDDEGNDLVCAGNGQVAP